MPPTPSSATIYAIRGEVEVAFDWLEQGMVRRDPGMVWLRAHQRYFLALQHDPRWPALLKRVGFPD